jgi:hypothetical protein
MLSSTYIIRFIEKKLGYKFNELEITHDEILENIQEESLITFSKYYPYQVMETIDDSQKVEDTANEYYINTDFEILGVAKLYDNFSMYVDVGLMPNNIRQMADPMSRQFMADATSINRNPLVYQFNHPNTITVMPALYMLKQAKVKLNCVHPNHFGTIPTNLQDEFLKLALYDTKESLYQIRHRFANLQTAFGNIELFIDDLAEASDKKQELLENWRKNFAKQSNRKKLYIY